ncbi:MAG: peptidylprolyl isomerase [Erythrobacter sp.]
MNRMILGAPAALACALAGVASLAAAAEPATHHSPGEIVAAAPKADWAAIAAEDLLVMTLAPDADGNPRQVIIQFMPAPFSQGWAHNIRLLARSGWYDGTSVNRVQDNYVTQWGDPNYDNPEASGEPKPLPDGLKVMGEEEYVLGDNPSNSYCGHHVCPPNQQVKLGQNRTFEPYAVGAFAAGWPVGLRGNQAWPVHCYGMVGVGRNYSPDTGSGAELYTVIGHAPRHLDRNIALVGRVIEGMEHLSSLPRGKGELGFYAADEADKRTPILSVRVASDLPAASASSSEAVGQQTRPASSSAAVGQETQPKFEYLDTGSQTFAAYADAIANRRDPFFITPGGGADICNIRVPVRRIEQ